MKYLIIAYAALCLLITFPISAASAGSLREDGKVVAKRRCRANENEEQLDPGAISDTLTGPKGAYGAASAGTDCDIIVIESDPTGLF